MSPTAYSDISDIEFQQYSIAEGLSQNTVTAITQDPQGYLWFATIDGLNRFDGYQFHQYHHDPNDPHSLPGQFIRELHVDTQGQLWVGTYQNGLARYNPHTDNFIRYPLHLSTGTGSTIWSLSSTQATPLLVADENQLYQLDSDSDTFKPYPLAPGSQFPADTKVIIPGASHTLLGTHGNGLHLLDKQGTITPFTEFQAKSVFDYKTIDGRLWLATDQGVFVTDSHFVLDTQYRAPDIASNVVRAIETLNNQVWLGTDQGISIIDLQQRHITNINSDAQASVGLESNFIFDLFKDTKNNMWLGGYTGGVHKYNPDQVVVKHIAGNTNPNGLKGKVVWAVKEDQQGFVWLATQNGGLNRYNSETGQFDHYLQTPSLTLFDMSIDHLNRIWLSAAEGIFLYEIVGHQLRKLRSFSPPHTVYKMKLLANKLWLASAESNQLNYIDITTLEQDSIAIDGNNISRVYPEFIDDNNNLWLLTNSGLALLNLSTLAITQRVYDTQDRGVNLVAAIQVGEHFWLANNGNSLWKLDKNYHFIDKYTINDGLSGNVFTHLLHDEQGIWISHLKGVDYLKLSDNQIRNVINNNMLDRGSLNENGGLFSSSGKIYLGGSEGFYQFNPTKALTYKREQLTPPVISELNVRGLIIKPGDDSPLPEAVSFLDTLTLQNDAYPFALTLTAVNPLEADRVRYRYKLAGVTNGWLLADNRTRQAIFTNNLLFGNYEFEAQARYGDGPWSESRKLTIHIQPPFWLNQHAIVVYCVLVLLVVSYWMRQLNQRRKTNLAIKDSEERLKLTLWSSGDELWDWDVFRGEVHRSNTWDVIDFPQDNIRANSSYQANIHPNDINKVKQTLQAHLEDESEFYETTYRVKTFAGDWLWLLDRGKVVRRDANQQALRMTGTLKNISHLKQAEEQLKLFERSIENISDAVFITETDFRFISVNQAYCNCTGETKEQALASYLCFRQYPDAFTEEVYKALKSRGNWCGEVEARRLNGEKYEMELNIDAVKRADGSVSHFVGVFSDISTRKSTEKELLKLANTDPLTELPNRSFFQASHNNLVRKGLPHVLFCLDMDNFKKINDSLGHQTGDILIKQIAKRLQKLTSVHSTCYRLGGDEFALLLEDTTDMHNITRFAQRILDDLHTPFLLNNQEFVLGASIGIAFYPEDGQTPQELLKNADTAMYFAKNAGGNKYQFFSGEMNQNAVRQLQIENLIRQGLKDDSFTVFYQPKVDIDSSKLVSMEALVRFEHPQKGYVSPAQFIPLAEKTGQIVEIGEVVMRKACADTKHWVERGLFSGRVAINISARQFELPDLDSRIEKILHQVGLSPLHLECEITEGTLMHNPEQAMRMMQRLKNMGVHLALDDFGTGYSSLAYLKQFPLNTLKIDKAFIDDIATSSVDKHMAAAIINIAHNLGLKVVAEGVETEAQLDILRLYQCEMLQGFLISKPLRASRFEQLLKQGLPNNESLSLNAPA